MDLEPQSGVHHHVVLPSWLLPSWLLPHQSDPSIADRPQVFLHALVTDDSNCLHVRHLLSLLRSSSKSSAFSRTCGCLPAYAVTAHWLHPDVDCWSMPCRWRRGLRTLQCLRRPAGIGTPQPLLLSWCAVLCVMYTSKPTSPLWMVSITHTDACLGTLPGHCACANVFVRMMGSLPLLLLLRSLLHAQIQGRCHGRLYQMCHHLSATQVRKASLGLLNEAFLS